MNFTWRTHLIFIVALLVATFGTGQLWNLARVLRAGESSFVDAVMGLVGLGLLTGSGLLLVRILYLVSNRSKVAQVREQEVYDDSHRGNP